MPWSFLNSPAIQSTIALSKLSPPRWLSPAVDLTSKTPSPSSSTDTSNVPPPRSKTRIVCSAPSLSRPYASAAEVGLGVRLQLLEDHRADLRRGVFLPVGLHAHVVVRALDDLVGHDLHLLRDLLVLPAHEALDRENR